MPFTYPDILPTPPQRTDEETDFADRADLWVVALQAYSVQLNTLIDEFAVLASVVGSASAISDDGLIAMLGNTPAADKYIYFTSGSASATGTITSEARDLLAASSQYTFSLPVVATNQNSSTLGAVVVRDASGDPGGGYIQWTNNAQTVEYCFIRGVSGSIQIGGNIHPADDNGNTCGLISKRWTEIFATTGTINTSDEREKQWRGGLSAAELRAGKRIIAELGFYQWIDAIEKKGDAARLHFGARAQRVWAIMADEGLVEPITDGRPGDAPYAFLCWDEWDDGTRYGLRVDQLTLFLVACLEARISAMEG